MKISIPCNALDCKHNDKDAENPKCTTIPKVSKDAKCYSVETDMGYLREKWRYVPGVESVKSHRIGYYDKAVRGEVTD